MLDAQLYFLSDQYYIDFPDDKLMKNKDVIQGVPHSRPCFLAFPDSKNPAIYWLVPISSRYEKYQKIAQAKIEKYGRCNTIRFGTVLGRNAAFLIQNMCPVTEPYLIAYINKNSEPICLDDRIVADVTKNAREVLAIARRGAKVIFSRCFQNLSSIGSDPLKTKIGARRWSSDMSRFCFLFSQKLPYQSRFCRAEDAEQTRSCTLPKEKESMEWRNRSSLQRASQLWLDLTNLAVTTGYHSLS